jgi:hypothetical protein
MKLDYVAGNMTHRGRSLNIQDPGGSSAKKGALIPSTRVKRLVKLVRDRLSRGDIIDDKGGEACETEIEGRKKMECSKGSDGSDYSRHTSSIDVVRVHSSQAWLSQQIRSTVRTTRGERLVELMILKEVNCIWKT